MDKSTKEALNEFERGDNPTMQDMEREVWDDWWHDNLWYEEEQDLINECKRIRHEEDFPL